MNLEIARQIAEKAHAGQKRKNGEAYINHCIRVSNMAAEYSEEAAIVGMLHDVIEDSNINIKKIDNSINEILLDAIGFMTKRKTDSYLEYLLEMKDMGYIKSDPIGDSARIATQVKICDLKDNLNGATGTLWDKYMMAYYILTGEVYGNSL